MEKIVFFSWAPSCAPRIQHAQRRRRRRRRKHIQRKFFSKNQVTSENHHFPRRGRTSMAYYAYTYIHSLLTSGLGSNPGPTKFPDRSSKRSMSLHRLSLPPMQGREDGSCSAMERRRRHKRKLESWLSSSSSSSTPPIHSLAQSRELLPLLLSASVSPFVPVSQPPSSSSSHPRLQPILHRNSRRRRNPSTAVKLHLVMYARWGQENENAVPQTRPCEWAFLATLPGRDMLTPVCLLGMSSSFSPSMQLQIFLLSFTRGWISDTSGLLASKCEQEDLLLPSR